MYVFFTCLVLLLLFAVWMKRFYKFCFRILKRFDIDLHQRLDQEQV